MKDIRDFDREGSYLGHDYKVAVRLSENGKAPQVTSIEIEGIGRVPVPTVDEGITAEGAMQEAIDVAKAEIERRSK